MLANYLGPYCNFHIFLGSEIMLKVKCLTASILSVLCISLTHANDFKVLNQISKQPTHLQTGEYKGNYYVPSTLNTITWGYLGFVA